MIAFSIENFVHVLAVTKHKNAASSIGSSSARDFKREQEEENTMLDLLQPFTEEFNEDDASPSTPKKLG